MVKTTKKNLKKAFTITELVIVIAVIAILAAVLIPTLSGVVEKANQSVAMQEAQGEWTNYYAEIAADGDYETTDTYFVIHYDGTTPDYYYTVTGGQFDTTSNEYDSSKCKVGSLVVTIDSSNVAAATSSSPAVLASESGCVEIYRVYATAAAEAATTTTTTTLTSGSSYYVVVTYTGSNSEKATCNLIGKAISTSAISVTGVYDGTPSGTAITTTIGSTFTYSTSNYSVSFYAVS